MRTLLVWLVLVMVSVALWGLIVYLGILAAAYYYLDPFLTILALFTAAASE